MITQRTPLRGTEALEDILDVITATDNSKLLTCGLPKSGIICVVFWNRDGCMDHTSSPLGKPLIIDFSF